MLSNMLTPHTNVHDVKFMVDPLYKMSSVLETGVYVIESAGHGVLFTSRLCQKPERARYERVRAFDTNNE